MNSLFQAHFYRFSEQMNRYKVLVWKLSFREHFYRFSAVTQWLRRTVAINLVHTEWAFPLYRQFFDRSGVVTQSPFLYERLFSHNRLQLTQTEYIYVIQVILDNQRLNIYAFPIPWSENHVEFSIFENCQQRRQTDSRENQHNKLYFC